MNLVRLNIHNSREGILTFFDSTLTMISDQDIRAGDAILHPLYTKIVENNVSTIVVQSIDEERPSRGEWKDTPSTFRKIHFRREIVSGDILKDKGYLRIEVIMEGGKQIQKAYLQI